MSFNQIENLKILVRNWITAMLHALESADAALDAEINNRHHHTRLFTSQLLDPSAEAQKVLNCQILQILDENGMDTEAFVSAFNTARSQWTSSGFRNGVQDGVLYFLQEIGEIPSIPTNGIPELPEELKTYYENILSHRSFFLRDVFQEAIQLVADVASPLRQPNPGLENTIRKGYIAEVKEMLRKFLEIETNQYNNNN